MIPLMIPLMNQENPAFGRSVRSLSLTQISRQVSSLQAPHLAVPSLQPRWTTSLSSQGVHVRGRDGRKNDAWRINYMVKQSEKKSGE